MTSPEPPRPHTRTASGAGLDEDTMHLPLTKPDPATRPGDSRRTIPSPYPPRAPFQPPPSPSSAPHPSRPQPKRERWEGTGFRPDIQGLRAVAVMLVLLSHAGFAFASGGYVGVDVFFVISGFLITSLLVKEVFDTGRISIAGFFSRRARRILPAATVVTLATVAGVWLWFPVTRFEEVMRDAFTVVVYVVNYRFVVESNEYLNADQMPSPFQQYWSLAVEEQFYLLWPLLMLALLIMVKRVPRKAVNAAIATVVVIFVLSLIASVLVTESSRPTAYYATHTRAWELAGGAFLALTLPTWKKIPRYIAFPLGVLGLAAVVASAVAYDGDTPFPGYTALLPVAGTMLLIVAGTARGKNLVSSLLATAPFQFVGKISYSLYLWHWPVLILFPLALGIDGSLLLNVILLAGTFAIAQLSYQYVETPIRTAKPLKSNHFWGLATGVLCSLLAIGMIITATVSLNRVPGASGGETDLEAVEEPGSLEAIQRQLEDARDIDAVPDDLVPALSEVNEDRPAIYGDGCHLEYDEVEIPSDCAYGDTESETDVVLFGDSHAAQWFPALDAIAKEQGWRLLSWTKSACAPVDVDVINDQTGGLYEECGQWREHVYDKLDDAPYEMVIIGAADAATIVDSQSEGSVDEWSEGWTETLDHVTAAVDQTVVISDTPRTAGSDGQSAPECIALHLESIQTCSTEEPYAISHLERREAALERQEEAGVAIVDPTPWLCLDEYCPLVVENVLVYRDRHHLSTPYARSLSTVLGEALPEL